MIEPKIVQKDQASSHLTFLFIYCFFLLLLFIAKSHILLKIYMSVTAIFLFKYLRSDSICFSLHY